MKKHLSHLSSLKKGLLAGEGLLLDIGNLEKAYMCNNERLLEIEKVISLKQLMGKDWPELTKTKEVSFSLKKELFDTDFPEHYNRRIKSVSITIPAVVGPYQNVYATLNQVNNTIYRTKDATSEDAKVLKDFRSQQSIALSRAVNDSGLFILNFNDRRYLPFEGTGVESSWRLSFSKSADKQIMESVSDIIIHLSYTAQP